MEPALLTESESIEREAYCDLFAGAGSPELRHRLGLSAERCGSALVLRSRVLDHELFNRAFGLTGSGPDADALAESVVARYRAQRITRYAVQVGAGAQPCATCERLEALGLVRAPRSWHRLVRGRGEVPRVTSALRIESAGAADAPTIAALLTDGLDLPDAARDLFVSALQRPFWHAYVARDVEGAAYATLLMYARGDRAYLALAATDRRHRRRGAERALIARAVQDALDLGCVEISAETPEVAPRHPNSSHHNLTETGFEVREVQELFNSRAALDQEEARVSRGSGVG